MNHSSAPPPQDPALSGFSKLIQLRQRLRSTDSEPGAVPRAVWAHRRGHGPWSQGAHNLIKSSHVNNPIWSPVQSQAAMRCCGEQKRKRLLPLGPGGEVPGRGGVYGHSALKEETERSLRRKGREHQRLGKQLGHRNRERPRFAISPWAFLVSYYPYLIEFYPTDVKKHRR